MDGARKLDCLGCEVNEFRCTDTVYRCVAQQLTCDGRNDCGTSGQDETGCGAMAFYFI